MEIEQIRRVADLLAEVGVCPAPCLVISTADGRTHMGRLVWQKVGNRLGKDGRVASYYGSLQLVAANAPIDIDYLDIVAIHLQERTAHAPKPTRGEQHRA